MNRGDIRGYVRSLLGEPDAANSFWTDADLNNYLNRGYEDIVVQGELIQCVSKTKSKAGTPSTMPEAGMYVLPPDTLMVVRVLFFDPTSSTWVLLQPKDEAELDKEAANWFMTLVDPGSIPLNWVVRSQFYHLYPATITVPASENIMLWCIQAPAPLLSDSDVPQISTGFHEAIAFATAVRALEADRTNPENRAMKQNLERDLARMMIRARSQDKRKSKQVMRLVDARDFQIYPSEWRWNSGA